MFVFSDLQVRIAVFCSVPDGDEHSFPWIRGCHKACFATCVTKVFVLQFVERVVVFGCQSACVRSLCLWCCACLVEFWLLFRDASVDLHMCVGNGCARCCANPQDSSRCCFRHILSMLCHMFSDGSANCLRVFNRVDDETNESLFTLCHASWPMN